MPSQLKSDTARRNGAKSKGPTTTAGLEKSSQNATKHGLTSGSAIVLACEIQAEFDNILNDFIATYQPANPAEKDLVEEMVAARWRIRRLWTIETCMLDAEIVKQESITTTHHPGIHLALAFRTLADNSRSLHLTTRYESRLHRIYDHAYATLRELQQIRLNPPAQPPAPDIREPEPAEPNTHEPDIREPEPAGPGTHEPDIREPEVPSDRPQSATDESAKRTQPTTKSPESTSMPPQPSNIQHPTSGFRNHPASNIQHPTSGFYNN